MKLVEILKAVSTNPKKKSGNDESEHKNMMSFLEACEYEARKYASDYKTSELLLDFNEKLFVQVDNYQNKKKEEQLKLDELSKLRQDAANGAFGSV